MDLRTEEEKKICEDCGEICSKHCVIYRKVVERKEELERRNDGQEGISHVSG